MRNKIVRWVLLLLLKALKIKPMKSSSIDGIIKNKVLSRLLPDDKSKSISLQVTNNTEIVKIQYRVELHGNFIEFAIESKDDKIVVYFIKSDIKHMSTLHEYFGKILYNIRVEETDLLGHFYIRANG